MWYNFESCQKKWFTTSRTACCWIASTVLQVMDYFNSTTCNGLLHLMLLSERSLTVRLFIRLIKSKRQMRDVKLDVISPGLHCDYGVMAELLCEILWWGTALPTVSLLFLIGAQGRHGISCPPLRAPQPLPPPLPPDSHSWYFQWLQKHHQYTLQVSCHSQMWSAQQWKAGHIE